MGLPAELAELAKAVSNWGRWGDDDERGTVNLIDADAVRRGAAAVRHGRTFPLSIRFDREGPQPPASMRLNPVRTSLELNNPYTGDPADVCVNDDMVVMGVQAATHWDALSHISYDGLLYNGHPASSVTAEAGATRCGIEKLGAIVSRGVLLDVARTLGVDWIEPGYAITADDLDAAADAASLAVEPGDVVLVRTGQIRHFKEGRKREYVNALGGLSTLTIEWFHARDVAAVATDCLAFEAIPGVDPSYFLPVHMIQVRDMGLTQGQHFDLEDLAADCADDGVYEFLLEASPIPITGASGAPVHPVATK